MITYRVVKVPDGTGKDPDSYSIMAQVLLPGMKVYRDFIHTRRNKPEYQKTQIQLLHHDIQEVYPDAKLDMSDPYNIAPYQPLKNLTKEEEEKLLLLLTLFRRMPESYVYTMRIQADTSGRIHTKDYTLFSWDNLQEGINRLQDFLEEKNKEER